MSDRGWVREFAVGIGTKNILSVWWILLVRCLLGWSLVIMVVTFVNKGW